MYVSSPHNMIKLVQLTFSYRCSRRRDVCSPTNFYLIPNANRTFRPLNPSELAVLRAQYEKEGDMVGIQTKFNYAWVNIPPPLLQNISYLPTTSKAYKNKNDKSKGILVLTRV